MKLECKYCKGTKFYEGPSGGLSVIIICQNENCKHIFNHEKWPDGLEKLTDLNKISE